LKENEKFLTDPKIPLDKKVSMMYEKAVKAVKELGAVKKQ